MYIKQTDTDIWYMHILVQLIASILVFLGVRLLQVLLASLVFSCTVTSTVLLMI